MKSRNIQCNLKMTLKKNLEKKIPPGSDPAENT
jgi:hypothetical protein